MACNKDFECLRISNAIYPNLKNDINGSVNMVTNNISETVSILETLYIPEDYLGNKVKNQIQVICGNLDEDISNINMFNSNINEFINEKIIEHKRHYNTWKLAQEKKKNEIDNTSSNKSDMMEK